MPLNYADEVNLYLTIHGKKKANELEDICIGLGADDMTGQNLTTNFVRVDLK